MFGISFSELAIISLLILVVMGPEKLPEVARWAGKGMRELRRASNTLRDALTIDDLDPRRQIDRPKADDRPPSRQPSAPPTEAIRPPTTSDTGHAPPQGPPVALDQVDDAHFEALLEQQFQHRSALRTVSIANAGHCEDLITAFIEPHQITDTMITVDLRRAEVLP